jgi:hypothetical protein
VSWEIFLVRFDHVYDHVDDIPKDSTSLPLGSRLDVMTVIKDTFPGVEGDLDPFWESADGGHIEFSLHEDEGGVVSIRLGMHVGDEGVAGVFALADKLKAQAISTATGDFMDPDDAEAGLAAWAEFKNRMMEFANNPEQLVQDTPPPARPRPRGLARFSRP